MTTKHFAEPTPTRADGRPVPISDLRSWIALLRDEGELVDVIAEVDPHLEITEIADRVIRAGGPALLFRRPKGSAHPLLINQFGTERRMRLALGGQSFDALAEKVSTVFTARPEQEGDQRRFFARLNRFASSVPRVVRNAPCQELVGEPNLDLFPIQTCWPGDTAPFITLPAVITKHPRTGARNVGIYRMQKIDARTTYMHWQVHKDGAGDWRAMTDRLDVAVALGCDPIIPFTASMPLPRGVDELALAGYLRGAPVELVRAKTVDLEVPAHAEIILEGYVKSGEMGMEGPFGDHTGYYTPPEPFPVFHITCVTMRKDAIYPTIVVGIPPAEDAWLGKASERLAVPALRAAHPEIVDLDLPVAGVFQHCAIVSIRKSFPGHARKIMYALWGTGVFALLKSIVVVDAFVNVHDYEQVFFHACANVDPKRDCLLAEGPIDQLDHSSLLHCYGGKLGVDATHKWPSEGARPWPDRIAMSTSIHELVDRRWDEYHLGVDFIPGRGCESGRRDGIAREE